MNHKLTIGIKNNKVVGIDSVENGIDCGCVCSFCGSSLIANKEDYYDDHYFSHKDSLTCDYAVESSILLAAKDILKKKKKIKVPLPQGLTGSQKIEARFLGQMINFDTVTLEKKLGGLLIHVGEVKMIIRIAAIHFISDAEIELVKKLGISTIEIDISLVNKLITLKSLEHILINNLDIKRWVYNKKEIPIVILKKNKISICEEKFKNVVYNEDDPDEERISIEESNRRFERFTRSLNKHYWS